MKRHHLIILVTGLASCSLTADTIELKSGTTYKGSVLSEDAQSYMVEINYTASIKDKRRIPKDEILKITREAKDAKDFELIKSSLPTPDGLSEKSYSTRIKRAEDFIKKYPRTTHTKEVTTILETLKKENSVISKGGLKLNGKLIQGEDMQANAYDIHAGIILGKLKKQERAGNYSLALRQWEKLQQNYSHSSAYKSSLPHASRILKHYQTGLKKSLDSLDSRTERRKTAIQSLEGNDRARSEAMLREKDARYTTLIEKEEKQLKTKWLTIDPYNKKALEYNYRNTSSALSKINSTVTSKLTFAGPHLREAWAALAKNDLKSVELHLKSIKSMRIPAEYTDPITTELKSKINEEKQAKQAAEAAEIKAKADEAKAIQDAAAEADKKGKKGKKN